MKKNITEENLIQFLTQILIITERRWIVLLTKIFLSKTPNPWDFFNSNTNSGPFDKLSNTIKNDLLIFLIFCIMIGIAFFIFYITTRKKNITLLKLSIFLVAFGIFFLFALFL